MHILYMDESGTPDIPGNTSHFVLAGVSIPVNYWKAHDQEIEIIKSHYDLASAEIHAGWILRPYLEQRRIPDFEHLTHTERRSQMDRLRAQELLRLQRAHNPKRYHQAKKNFNQESGYIHLTYDERRAFIKEVATRIGQWGSRQVIR